MNLLPRHLRFWSPMRMPPRRANLRSRLTLYVLSLPPPTQPADVRSPKVAETTTLPPVDIPPADAAEKTEEDADDSSAANPEDVRLLIQDMARVSAKNKNYLEKAAAMRARVQKINDETTALRMALMVEQVRRQRMETYFKHWRPIAPKWSYSEVWDGPITLAPVFVRFENAKGSIVMDKEVSTSDDEELVSEWHLQHEQFLARRKASAEKKAEERGVDVEMVSDEEMASDEEDFYSPFVLRPKDVDGTMPDSKCHVYPLFDRLARGVSVYLDEDIVVPSCSKRRLADNAQSDDEARYSPRARIDEALDEKEDAALEKKEDDAEDWEKNIAIKMGEAVDSKWEGLGVMQDGWRMRVNL
ncbi:hypothetical protein FB451DRAFT_208228 [Mycena latifolia]|nr:hypothetical protein FB451DRAFT_208228 [Mycena latifolia]